MCPPQFKECIAKYAAAAPEDIEREFFSHALDDAQAVGSVNKLFVSAAIGRLQTQSRLMLDSGEHEQRFAVRDAPACVC